MRVGLRGVFVCAGLRRLARHHTRARRQVYVLGRGGGGTVYHNKYAIANDKGRVVVSTAKAAQYVRATMRSGGDSAPGGGGAVASREGKLNEQLDALTRAVVAHLEGLGHVRVLGITLTYALDVDTGQPVLLWAGDITVRAGGSSGRD